MSAEENKAIVRQFIERVANQGNLDRTFEFISPELVDHAGAAGQAPGIENSMRAASLFRSAFPPWRSEIEDMFSEGDQVVFRGTSSGTHQGEFMGIPPTGKQISMSGVHIMRLSNGKVIEHWAPSDMMGFMQQFGITPDPVQMNS